MKNVLKNLKISLVVCLFFLAVGCTSKWNEFPANKPYPVVVQNLCDGGSGTGALTDGKVYTADHVVKDCPFAVVYKRLS